MKELLETVVQLEVYPAAEKALNFRLDCPENFHRGFLGDEVRIKQCLINLVSNAIKFTPEQGTVTLTYREQTESGGYTKAYFAVEDTGIGMSEAFMKQMFHPFEQEQSSLTSSHVGSGLGLAIVHSLVTLMNGTIHAESKLNQGSRFIIELPLERTRLSEPVPEQGGHRGITRIPARQENPAGGRQRNQPRDCHRAFIRSGLCSRWGSKRRRGSGTL